MDKVFKVDGVEFMPYKWDFCNDGKWGHIYFLVPAGTFIPDGNNGAYAWSKKTVEKEALSVDEYEMSILDPEKHQVVHMATPCMGNQDVDGFRCEQYKFSDILEAACKEIMINLKFAKNT